MSKQPLTWTWNSSALDVSECLRVSKSVPGKYLVVSVIFDAVLQGNVHSIPATFAESRVRQVACAYTHAHSYPPPPHNESELQTEDLQWKDEPGKNPGENLCRDTVMTLDVKLKASSTPAGRTKGEIHHGFKARNVPLIDEIHSDSWFILSAYCLALKIHFGQSWILKSVVCAFTYHLRDAGLRPHKGLFHISPSAAGYPTRRRSHSRNPKLHPWKNKAIKLQGPAMPTGTAVMLRCIIESFGCRVYCYY